MGIPGMEETVITAVGACSVFLLPGAWQRFVRFRQGRALVKKVDAVIVGAGAGGGVVAKELAVNGLSVVLLERGKWYTPNDCRKDDLRNQRNSTLGNNTGPDDEGNLALWWTLQETSALSWPAGPDMETMLPAWGVGQRPTALKHGDFIPMTFA